MRRPPILRPGITTLAEVVALWARRTGGSDVECPRCAASRMALQVDAYAYRWACVACGAFSLWFLIDKDDAVRLIGQAMALANREL